MRSLFALIAIGVAVTTPAQEWLVEYKPEGQSKAFRKDGSVVLVDSTVEWETLYPTWTSNMSLGSQMLRLGSGTTEASLSMIGQIRVRVTYQGPHGYTAVWMRTDSTATWSGGSNGYASNGLQDMAVPLPNGGEESKGARVVRYELTNGQAEF